MNQSVNSNDEPNFTSFLLGELEGPERDQIAAMLEDPSSTGLEEEVGATEAMIALLSESFESEWKSADVFDANESRPTSFALGELDNATAEDFAASELEAVRLMSEILSDSLESEWKSVDVFPSEQTDTTSFALGELEGIASDGFDASEIEAVQFMSGILSDSLEREWSAHVPVDLDSPNFTDYASGELEGFEKEKFEALLRGSSTAEKELGANQDFINLLSGELKEEWETAAAETSSFEGKQPEDPKVVKVDFVAQAPTDSPRSREKKKMNRRSVPATLAAVLAGLLVVGAMMALNYHRETGQNFAVVKNVMNIGISSNGESWFDEKATPTEIVQAPMEMELASTPSLVLMEEIKVGDVAANQSIDSSYNIGGKVNVALQQSATQPAVPQAMDGFDRVDSFLPPVKTGKVTYSMKESIIGGQSARTFLVSDHRHHVNGFESVLVQGIVTFPEGVDFNMDQVSLSFDEATPVTPGSAFSNEYQNLQSELESIAREMGDDSKLKSQLQEVIEQYKQLGNRITAE